MNVCVRARACAVCAVHVYRSVQVEDNLEEVVLFFHLCLASGDQTWVIRLVWQVLYPILPAQEGALQSYTGLER